MMNRVPSEDVNPPIPPDWLAEFEAAAKRTLEQRWKYAFYKPVMDDAKYRPFESMAEYRQWCEDNLPRWLGYGRFWISPGAGNT